MVLYHPAAGLLWPLRPFPIFLACCPIQFKSFTDVAQKVVSKENFPFGFLPCLCSRRACSAFVCLWRSVFRFSLTQSQLKAEQALPLHKRRLRNISPFFEKDHEARHTVFRAFMVFFLCQILPGFTKIFPNFLQFLTSNCPMITSKFCKFKTNPQNPECQ